MNRKFWSKLSLACKAGAPLLCGVGVAVFLAYVAEGEQGAFTNRIVDANTWSFGHLALSTEILLFGILLLSNFFTIGVGVIIYLVDIGRAHRSYKSLMKEDSGWASVGFAITCISLIVLFIWICAFLYEAVVPHPSLGSFSAYALSEEFKFRSATLAGLLKQSSLMALLLFVLFLFIDLSLLNVMKKIQEKRDQQFIQDHYSDLRKVRVAVAVARGSIWYVDFPGIIAGLLLFAIGLWVEGLHHVANGLTDLGAAIFNPYNWDGRSVVPVDGPIEAISLTFSLGFAAGVHVLQLFLSQVVFAIIVVRSESAG